MHNLDRTQLETQSYEAGELGEMGGEGPLSEEAAELASPLSENEEVELATELLEVTSEQEFGQFLGNVFRSVGSGVGQFMRSDVGRHLGTALRDSARYALPRLGGVVGQWINPNGGRALGARIARDAGSLFGLELEGLSAEDREFEIARQFVRFAATAARRALGLPPNAPAAAIAQRALQAASQAFAPGVPQRLPGRTSNAWPRSGRWVRRGRTIVLMGA